MTQSARDNENSKILTENISHNNKKFQSNFEV